MALDVSRMNENQLSICVNKAYQVTEILENYNNQISSKISSVYNDCLNMLDNDNFKDLESTYPSLYKYITSNENVGNAIRKRKWNKAMRWVTNPYVILVFICILFLLSNDAFDDVTFLLVAGGLAIFFISKKFPSIGDFRWNLLERGCTKFVDRINANLDVILEGAKIQTQEEVHLMIENRTNDLLSDVSSIACYEAIPEEMRSKDALLKMQLLLRQKIVTNWKELAGTTRRELHSEALASRVISSINGLGEQLTTIQQNQMKLISQNEEIKDVLHSIENTQLSRLKALQQMNQNLQNLQQVASSINAKTRAIADASIDTNYRIRKAM